MRLTQLSVLIGTGLCAAAVQAAPPLDPEQQLGHALYTDKNLSLERNQSCASCHSLAPVNKRLPVPGFADPDNVANGTPVSAGSVAGRSGKLNAPSAGYAAFSPYFHWDGEAGLYKGGQFWNGRARMLAEQAAGPFLNPDEMAMPSAWAVVTRLKENPQYVQAFRTVYDLDLNAIPAYEKAAAAQTPPPGVREVYDRLTQAIAAFEKGPVFNRFTSKYDFYLARMATLTPLERKGLTIFNSARKGNCAACHPSSPTIAPDGSAFPPMFTDYTYDNIGAPRNVMIPGNPEPDPGLGGRPDIAARDGSGAELGKHKVMTLRNIALTPPYGHNGVFATLEQAVHFYNTRDVLGPVPNNRDPGFGVSGWPAPEVTQNVNTAELGNLGLTADEEKALVAFLHTLTDGYPDWGRDPKVPPGTPSPFAATPLPPLP